MVTIERRPKNIETVGQGRLIPLAEMPGKALVFHRRPNSGVLIGDIEHGNFDAIRLCSWDPGHLHVQIGEVVNGEVVSAQYQRIKIGAPYLLDGSGAKLKTFYKQKWPDIYKKSNLNIALVVPQNAQVLRSELYPEQRSYRNSNQR